MDSADLDRLDIARTELLAIFQEDELQKVPLLILANKQVKFYIEVEN